MFPLLSIDWAECPAGETDEVFLRLSNMFRMIITISTSNRIIDTITIIKAITKIPVSREGEYNFWIFCAA